ncbi:rhodanese-like domain-containing protein [Aerococcaceae bacterium DSM 111020]|nr:rhodanese-like domain-containing protein [Aerococcaceae bacterium DSM 111020]
MKQIQPDELYRLVENNEDLNIIDVRSEAHYKEGHVPGAVNIPLSSLEDNLNKLDNTKTYHLICQRGLSSKEATELLTDKGFNAVNVAEGTPSYPGPLEK